MTSPTVFSSVRSSDGISTSYSSSNAITNSNKSKESASKSSLKEASKVISLSAQFGEGWLLPGEILSLARQGVDHVVSLQPFGCIANHIVARGIENRIKRIYPDLHLLSLDFDSGVSDVNIVNRLLLFINDLETIRKI